MRGQGNADVRLVSHGVDDITRKEQTVFERLHPRAIRALTSALTIAGAYVAGGFIPLSPYMVLGSVWHSLLFSAAVTLAALGVFGYIKGRFTGAKPFRSASQTIVIGGLAAAAAFALAKLIS